MVPPEIQGDGRVHEWLPWCGLAAVVGTVLSLGMPWVQTAILGTRPYVTSIFDVGSFIGWLLMLVGLVGVYTMFYDQFNRVGRVSLWVTTVGMGVISVLLFRRVILFVEAGFQAVPATGENPLDLLLSILTILGFGLAVVGAGGIGLALHRVKNRPFVAPWLLVFTPIIPLILIGFNLVVDLPLPVGRLLVNTNVILIPLGLGWVALGIVIWSHTYSVSRTTR